jgi:hypothetical protein
MEFKADASRLDLPTQAGNILPAPWAAMPDATFDVSAALVGVVTDVRFSYPSIPSWF